MAKRNVEVFSAGCGACQETIDLINNVACPSCEITVHDMHDAAVAARAHRLGERLARKEGAGEIAIEHFVPERLVELWRRHASRKAADVVDENVHAAERGDRGVHHAAHCIGVGDVRLDRERAPAELVH